MSEFMDYGMPLVLTVLIEGISAYVLGVRKGKDLLLTVLANCITNPLLVLSGAFLMYTVGTGKGLLITYAVLEPLVIYAEYRIYRAFLSCEKDPFILSLFLNLISVCGGILWNLFI